MSLRPLLIPVKDKSVMYVVASFGEIAIMINRFFDPKRKKTSESYLQLRFPQKIADFHPKNLQNPVSFEVEQANSPHDRPN